MAKVEVVKFGLSCSGAHTPEVWGIARVEGNVYSFWGPSGGRLQSTPHSSIFDVIDEWKQKLTNRIVSPVSETIGMMAVFPDVHYEIVRSL
jgi:hypothetical protein